LRKSVLLTEVRICITADTQTTASSTSMNIQPETVMTTGISSEAQQNIIRVITAESKTANTSVKINFLLFMISSEIHFTDIITQ